MVPTSSQVRLMLAAPLLKPPRVVLIAVALPRPGCGLLEVIVTVPSKFGVAAGIPHAFIAVTVALNGCPAVSGAAGMPLNTNDAGATTNEPLPVMAPPGGAGAPGGRSNRPRH